MLAELIPGEPEVLGLLALMELQASRVGARADADGNLVLLADQDRARWDRARIARALSCLDAAGPIERAGSGTPWMRCSRRSISIRQRWTRAPGGGGPRGRSGSVTSCSVR